MKTTLNAVFGSTSAIGLGLALMAQAQTSPDRGSVRIPESTHNLLLEAKVSGNLESYQKGQRGAPEHVIYDVAHGGFVKASQWHEYGVGFGADLGIVPEDKPAHWLAQWPQPVEANFIALSGVYDNQPQPHTAWITELRREGTWTTHARGVGGWYDRGRYVQFTARAVSGAPTIYTWDFGNAQTAQGVKVSHTFSQPGIFQVKLTATDGRFSDDCLALVRAHKAEALHVPQVLLDTDAKNEQDDQHYLGYRWTKTDSPGSVRVIRQIDQQAMQRDIFDSMKGRSTKLVGVEGTRL